MAASVFLPVLTLALALVAASQSDAARIQMFDMDMTGTTLAAVVSEVSSMPASDSSRSVGPESSIGTFVGGPPGIGRGVYLTSSVPGATGSVASHRVSLEFTVTPQTSAIALSFVYLLAGPYVPVDHDFSTAFEITLAGQQCQSHGRAQRYTMYNTSIQTLGPAAAAVPTADGMPYMSSDNVIMCTKRVSPGLPARVSVKARNTLVNYEHHENHQVSSAVLLFAESLEEEYFRCEPRSTGSSCFHLVSPGMCLRRPCAGMTYHADMDGSTCCALASKQALTACPNSDFEAGPACCQEIRLDSMVPVDPGMCLA